jgi:hypothetical protein
VTGGNCTNLGKKIAHGVFICFLQEFAIAVGGVWRKLRSVRVFVSITVTAFFLERWDGVANKCNSSF